MNLIMKDQADKSWIRSCRELTEPEQAMANHDRGALIGIVFTLIVSVIVLCSLVLTVNKANPIDALDDCVLSPDMQSFISTRKEPVTIGIEDTQ